jgi:hypothetical protein
VALLGMPPRIPVVGHVYRMPPDYYDPTDIVWHPVLVVSLDRVAREAGVVTRTTRYHARGSRSVVHAPQPDLNLDLPGWWRLNWIMPVAFVLFGEPDVQHLGQLETGAWHRVLTAMGGGRQ